MFASLTKSIKSFTRGPRAILASQIAKALSEHFVLDPADIESSLLKEAKIVLKDTQLRDRRYRSADAPNAVVSVRGVVKEVVFSWRWSFGAGGNSSESSAAGVGGKYASGSGMVQDVMLTIKGLSIHIDLQAWGDIDQEEKILIEGLDSASLVHQNNEGLEDDSNDRGGKNTIAKSENESFMEKYIQQIVDHLTVKVEDFQIVLQANRSSLVISGNDIELGTLSSAKIPTKQENEATATMLSQKLSV